jgi:hypothetical protein
VLLQLLLASFSVLAAIFCSKILHCGNRARQEAASATPESDREALLARLASRLAGMVRGAPDCGTFDDCLPASRRIQIILEMDLMEWSQGRQEVSQQGTARIDLPYGRRKSHLGNAVHSWRVEDARLRYLGAHGSTLMRKTPRNPEPARQWTAFLSNHREAIAATDFFTLPTLTFGIGPSILWERPSKPADYRKRSHEWHANARMVATELPDDPTNSSFPYYMCRNGFAPRQRLRAGAGSHRAFETFRRAQPTLDSGSRSHARG